MTRALEMHAAGANVYEIAKAVGMPPYLVRHRLDMALAARRIRQIAVERPCLRCERSFGSEGPHNRICDDCKGSPDWIGSPAQHDMTSRGRRVGAA